MFFVRRKIVDRILGGSVSRHEQHDQLWGSTMMNDDDDDGDDDDDYGDGDGNDDGSGDDDNNCDDNEL